jgi:HEAT repeat protein
MPDDDPRSVDELMTTALCEPDEDLAWDAVCILQNRLDRELLDRTIRLCGSYCAFERRVGADILGQSSVCDRAFPDERLGILLRMLETEEDHGALQAILAALSHQGKVEAIAPAARFRNHPDPEVRHAVVLVLMGHEEVHALKALIELTSDPAARVRDWATFALGTQAEADTPELREALVARLGDEDDDARCEALVGLARRKDRRVLEALRRELASDSVWTLAIEAAALFGDPLLHPLLVEIQESWDTDDGSLGDAIRACSLDEAIRACSPVPGLSIPPRPGDEPS